MKPKIDKAKIVTISRYERLYDLVKCRDSEGFNYWGRGTVRFGEVHYCSMEQCISLLRSEDTDIVEVIY